MPEIEFGNSSVDDSGTIRERVDVEVMSDGTRFPEPAEISTRPLGHQNVEIERLQTEVLQMKDRVAELERENAELRAKI